MPETMLSKGPRPSTRCSLSQTGYESFRETCQVIAVSLVNPLLPLSRMKVESRPQDDESC
jgi:hypothetical protein